MNYQKSSYFSSSKSSYHGPGSHEPRIHITEEKCLPQCYVNLQLEKAKV